MFNFKIWLKAAVIRAMKTICQAAVGLIPAAVMITEVDWPVVVGTSLLAGVVSLLTSVAGLPEVEYHAKLQDLKEMDDAILGDNGSGQNV